PRGRPIPCPSRLEKHPEDTKVRKGTRLERPVKPQVGAVVLAGGKADEAFRLAAGGGERGPAGGGGGARGAGGADALAAARTITRVVLVGDARMEGLGSVAARVEPAGDLFANVDRGLQACAGCDAVLLASADIPFVTAEAIDAFVSEGLASGAAIC